MQMQMALVEFSWRLQVLLIHHALWLAIFPDGHESLLVSCLPRLREGAEASNIFKHLDNFHPKKINPAIRRAFIAVLKDCS